MMFFSALLKRFCFFGLLLSLLIFWGCKKFTPPATSGDLPFKNRIQTETRKGISVSVAVPTAEETLRIFDTNLYAKGIQPVWVQVKNSTQDQLALLPSSVDPEYYSPNEAAYKTKEGYSDQGEWDRDIFFSRMSLPFDLPPKSVGTGYIFTHVDQPVKYIIFDLLTQKDLRRFNFLVEIPFQPGEYSRVDPDKLYSPGEIKELSLEDLRKKLEALPCCAPGKKGGGEGDPINFILVGNEEETLSALTRSGWRIAKFSDSPRLRIKDPSLNKRPYKYSLRTPLWLFGRPQDVGFYKAREKINEQNQFWIWLSPWRYEGKKVWVGTLSRDIGLRYSRQKPYVIITPKIDSDVDGTREYLIEDLIFAEAVEKLGWVKGVGAATLFDPKKDAVGDYWYTDGLRMVLFISERPVDINEIEVLEWEFPPRGVPLGAKTNRSKGGRTQ